MPWIRHKYAWLFCAFAALGACLYGYDGVYFTGVSAMSVFVEHFGEKQPDGSHAIAPSSLSLMTSVINIGELVGSLTAAPLNDYVGRKGVFLIASIMVVIGVILQLATDHKQSMIIGGRILLGYGVGNFSATSPLYIGVRDSPDSPIALRGTNDLTRDTGNRTHSDPRAPTHVLAACPVHLANYRGRYQSGHRKNSQHRRLSRPHGCAADLPFDRPQFPVVGARVAPLVTS